MILKISNGHLTADDEGRVAGEQPNRDQAPPKNSITPANQYCAGNCAAAPLPSRPPKTPNNFLAPLQENANPTKIRMRAYRYSQYPPRNLSMIILLLKLLVQATGAVKIKLVYC
jgi:hypothetical protein